MAFLSSNMVVMLYHKLPRFETSRAKRSCLNYEVYNVLATVVQQKKITPEALQH